MTILLFGHAFENFRRLRKLLLQAIRIRAVNARIILLRGNGEREDLLFGQPIEWTAAETKDTGEHAASG